MSAMMLRERVVFGQSCFLALLLVFLSFPPALHAQVLYGSLTGSVTDASDAVVPNAKVEASNAGTGVVKQTTTDSRGVYMFNDLQPGTYAVTISAPAFGSINQQGLVVNANTVQRLDATLQLSTVAETVTVQATAFTLQTDRADVNTQLKTRQIANLPIGAGRNFQQLYKLVPGFTPPADSNSDAGNPQRSLISNVNGVSQSNNNTRLDGATISYPWLPHIVAYVPPADAVEAVNIVTNSFDAEQGMAGGAAVNVQIKSGTNTYHGSAHEYHNSSHLKARNYFYCLYSCTGDPNQPAKNIQNQFGGTIGGPIKKNKLFFFGDFERTLRRQNASVFRSIATDAMRQGDFSNSGTVIYDPATGSANGTGRTPFVNNRIPANRIDPAALKMISLLPAVNQATVNNNVTNNYFSSGTYIFNRDNADIKVNYNATDRLMLFTRYSVSPSDLFDPPSLGAAGGDATNGGQPGKAPGLVQSSSIGATYTLSPRVLVDGTIGWTRQRLGAENVDIGKNYGLDDLNIPGTNGTDRLQGGYPRFVITNLSNLGNPNNSNPFLFRDSQYTGNANLSWTKGAHQFRFGAEYTLFVINHFQPQTVNGPRGGFTFSGALTALNGGASPNGYNSWGDFLLGMSASLGKDLQYINPDSVHMPAFGMYARDQWQVTRNLTINYGLRYEYYPFATRDHRGVERYDPVTDRVLVGGLGNVPTDTGVDVGNGQIAPRVGVAYRLGDKTVIRSGFGISIDPNTVRNLRDAYPAVISLQLNGATSFQSPRSLREGLPPIIGPDLSQGIVVLPPSIGTTTVPEKFNRGYIHSYNVTIERSLGAGFVFEAAYVGTRAIRQVAYVNINSAGPGGGAAGRALYQPSGRSADITQITPFNTATYNGLQTQLHHRFSSNAVFGAVYTFSRSINYADNSDSGLTFSYIPAYERNKALAGFDRTHNLQMYGIYELPFGASKRYLQSGVLGHLAGGWQTNATVSRTSGRPFTVATAGTSLNAPGGNTQTADLVMQNVAILGGHGNGQPYFDPNAFAPVTAVRFGNTGRNIIRGPGLFNLDASLFRNFRMTERFTMQFRAEAFGVTNTPQFGQPGATVSSATRNADNSIRALNGYSEITTATGERQFRFALKLIF
jgi:hypothetical protein